MNVHEGLDADITLVGTGHSGVEYDDVEQAIANSEPQLVCIEAKLGSDLSKRNKELFLADNMSDYLGAETWYIDLLEKNNQVFFNIVDETLSSDEKDKLFNSSMDVETQREIISTRSPELIGHNLRRESIMFATVQHATEAYDNITVVCGTAHYLQLKDLIRAL